MRFTRVTIFVALLFFGYGLTAAASSEKGSAPLDVEEGQLQLARRDALLNPANGFVVQQSAMGGTGGNDSSWPWGSGYPNENRVLNDRFLLQLGAYWPTINSTIRLDSVGGGIGTTLDLEDGLGLDEDLITPRVDFVWRFGERKKNRFEFSWYQINRDGARTLSATIEVGEETFNIGTTVNTVFDFSLYRVAYGRSFWKTDKYEIGGLIGAHVTYLKFGIETLGGLVAEAESITLPLPTLGVYGAYAITNRLSIEGRIQVFYLKFDEYEGSLINPFAQIQYDIHKNVALGIGYAGFFVDVEGEGDYIRGKVDFDINGPVAQVNFHF